MTQDLRASISAMKHVVAVVRAYRGEIPEDDRDRLVEILEEQIREMEQRQAEQAGAWS